MVSLDILNWMDLRKIPKTAFLFLLLAVAPFGLAKTKNKKRGSGATVFAEIFSFDMRSVFLGNITDSSISRFCFLFLST